MRFKLYDSVRKIPLYNWEQLETTGDLSWLIKKKGVLYKPLIADFEKAYFKLHDEYLEIVGGNQRMEKLWNLMVARIEAREKVGKGDKSQKNFVEIYTAQISKMTTVDDSANPVKERMRVQKLYKQSIDPKKITLYEYLMICEIVKEEISRSNGENNQ